MAYPAGVVLRTVTAGHSIAAESGTDLVLTGRIIASRDLIRDGVRMPSSPESDVSIPGGIVSFSVPVSDQSGYRDLATGAIIDVSVPDSHTHTYTIKLVTTRDGRQVGPERTIGPFALPTGDGSPVDADTLITAETVPGLLASVPDSWTAQIEAVADGIPAAVSDYLTANPPSGSPDATTLTKGIVKLAGDLGGTADLPTVPGLASKVETTDPRLSDARTPTAHTHDDRYYTEAEADALLSGKAPTSHTHGELHTHANAAALALVSGTNTGDQDLSGYATTGHSHAGTYAPALGADDNYVTDAEKAALHTHPAVIAQGATAADARAAIGAGTSSFTGAYADLSGKPTLGTAAATASTDYATAAQGAKADTALQPATGQSINAQTGTTYTLVAADAGKLVTLTNAAAITLTVPGSVFTAGQRIDVLVLGAGMVTVVGSSCTVNGTPSLVSRAQYSAFTVLFTSATTAVVVGDLASA